MYKRDSILDPIVLSTVCPAQLDQLPSCHIYMCQQSLCAIESENVLSDIKISYETLEEKYKRMKLENIEYARHVNHSQNIYTCTSNNTPQTKTKHMYRLLISSKQIVNYLKN